MASFLLHSVPCFDVQHLHIFLILSTELRLIDSFDTFHWLSGNKHVCNGVAGRLRSRLPAVGWISAKTISHWNLDIFFPHSHLAAANTIFKSRSHSDKESYIYVYTETKWNIRRSNIYSYLHALHANLNDGALFLSYIFQIGFFCFVGYQIKIADNFGRNGSILFCHMNRFCLENVSISYQLITT